MAKYNEKTPLQWVMLCREFSNESMAEVYCREFDSKDIDDLANDIRLYQHQIVYGRGIEPLLSSATYYLSRKDCHGWSKLVKYLRYPILVSSLIDFVSDQNMCVDLFHAVAVDTTKESIFIGMLLRQRWLDIVCRNVVDMNGREDVLSTVKTTIDDFCHYFPMENICIWVTDQPRNISAKVANNETLYADFIVNSICAYVHSKVDGDQIDVNIKRLNYLFFVAEPVMSTGHRLEMLWQSFVETITKSKFYWRKELDVNTLNDLRILSSVMANVFQDFPKSVLKQFATKMEGYGVSSYENIYNSYSTESFVLSSLLMISEHDEIDIEERAAIFQQVTNQLLKQCHSCDTTHVIEDYFFIPLVLAELITSQIINDKCIEWENAIVNSNMPLRVVTRILCAGQQHDTSTLRALSLRKESDWAVEKIRLQIMKTKGIEIIKATESNFLLLGI